ncbi:hypothetical protein BCV70DRAFT_202033 [Testicularia cyperi]|uniref:Uncharacterized protein n=1 Tax=Testicularia cyperi TaxID=1882483 RepID=A0A317XK87_9BASI|nr:hypothetical protein BCV70DRAFT_202033 [Testicularia cyperi]
MVNPLSYIQMIFKSVFSVFSPSTTTVWANGIAYSLTLHNPRLLLYRGPETYVTFSIYAQAYTPEAREKLRALSSKDTSAIVKQASVQLVQKGWIAGAVGWNAASYLGVSTKKGWDITPKSSAGWDDANASTASASSSSKFDDREDEDWAEKPQSRPSHDDSYELQTLDKNGRTSTSAAEARTETRHISVKRRETIDKQIRAQSAGLDLSDSDDSTTKVLGTFKCRVPVETGDGYFRLWVTIPTPIGSSAGAKAGGLFGGASTGTIAMGSPTFRLFSFSLSSASPRGAALLPVPVLVPELALRSISLAVTTLLYGLFPVAAIVDKLLPRWVSRRFMSWLYTRLGIKSRTDQLKSKYKVDERVDEAKQQAKKIPFATAGIRTEWDLEKDLQRGAAGWAYYR